MSVDRWRRTECDWDGLAVVAAGTGLRLATRLTPEPLSLVCCDAQVVDVDPGRNLGAVQHQAD